MDRGRSPRLPAVSRRDVLGATAAGSLFGLSGCAASVLGDDGAPELEFVEVARQRGFEYSGTGEHVGLGYGGVFVSDFDNDGREDLLAVGGGPPALFHNTGDGFRRSDALPELDVSRVKGALFFDYDNDGWDELLLLPRHDRPIFLDNVEGTFQRREIGLEVELESPKGASVADYTGNGFLDVFITQSGDWAERVPKRSGPDYEEIDGDNGAPNVLFEGDGERFERVDDAGITGDRWSLASTFVDLTGNGWPDIHVANDFNYDVLYLNNGDGTFERRELESTDRHGMASDAADITGNGYPDLFVTNIEFSNPDRVRAMKDALSVRNRGNNLLINQGDGEFVDRAAEYGVREGGWGWAGELVDLDNDGSLDLLHATKHYLADADNTSGFEPVHTEPSLWRRTESEEFERVDADSVGFETSDGRGLALLDIDSTGTLDVAIGTAAGQYKLYENRTDGGNWFAVDVAADPDQTPIGTTVTVTAGDRTQYRQYHCQSNFYAQSSRTLHFGLGSARTVSRLTTVWPDGTEWTFEELEANQSITITRAGEIERE